MTLRFAMTLAVLIVVGLCAVVAWLVSLRSAKWGNRIGVLGLLALIHGVITISLMPEEPR